MRRLVAVVAAEGIPTWYDDDIEPGQRFVRIILRRVEACAAVVVVTPASMAWHWVDTAMTYAAARHKPIVALCSTCATPPSGWPGSTGRT
ncbi:MAG TPA: TIR domain-containing protein [Rugosimonospora sp.]|nr:TIR domain-containing protein [Rugosimonospora sp.]